jgi:spermidine synthase
VALAASPCRGHASLYAANTAGAVLGVLSSGFFLIQWLGLTETARLAALLSILVGVVAVAASRGRPAPERSPDRPTGGWPPEETRARSGVLLLVMGGAGALGLSLEALRTRLLTQGSGSTAYVFAVVLALFLIGIALGSFRVQAIRPSSTGTTTSAPSWSPRRATPAGTGECP